MGRSRPAQARHQVHPSPRPPTIHLLREVSGYGPDTKRQAWSVAMLLLGVLVILWAVLIGSWLKDRASTRPGDSVSAFRDQLHTLQRTQPGGRRGALRA